MGVEKQKINNVSVYLCKDPCTKTYSQLHNREKPKALAG